MLGVAKAVWNFTKTHLQNLLLFLLSFQIRLATKHLQSGLLSTINISKKNSIKAGVRNFHYTTPDF